MASEVTSFPNGHDSTAMPENVSLWSTPEIQITGASEFEHLSTAEGSRPLPTTTSQPRRRITTEELYSQFENVSPELSSAIRLLSVSLQHIDEALLAHRKNDDIAADDAVQKVQALLPELFCCRSLGDGYGIVVNALMCGFQNLAGIPLSREQTEKIRHTLVKLRSEPFLREDEAVKAVTALEEVGLVIEPAEFEYLAEMLDE